MTGEALAKLRRLAEQRSNLEKQIADVVGLLRSPDLDGNVAASWEDVGRALGVTKQAAYQRYGAASAGVPLVLHKDGRCPCCHRGPASRHSPGCIFPGHVPRGGFTWDKSSDVLARVAGYRLVLR